MGRNPSGHPHGAVPPAAQPSARDTCPAPLPGLVAARLPRARRLFERDCPWACAVVWCHACFFADHAARISASACASPFQPNDGRLGSWVGITDAATSLMALVRRAGHSLISPPGGGAGFDLRRCPMAVVAAVRRPGFAVRLLKSTRGVRDDLTSRLRGTYPRSRTGAETMLLWSDTGRTVGWRWTVMFLKSLRSECLVRM